MNLSRLFPYLLGILTFFGLYLTSLYSFILFHSIAEVFSIVIACGLFLVAWNTRDLIKNNYLLFLGISYLFVGMIDFIHTLAYKGMGIFIGFDANLPTQLWIIARYMEAISLLIAPLGFRFKKRLNVNILFTIYLAASAIACLSVFYFNIFPDCFIEGKGLTPFKVISEYIISILLLGSIIFLYRLRERFDRQIFYLVVWSIVATIFSEISFTLYVSVYGLSNLIGHFFKIVSFYLIYKAILKTGFINPYSMLLKELKEEELRLKEAQGIARMGHWSLDVKTNKVVWSEEIFKIFKRDQNKGVPSFEEFLEIVHPEDRGTFISMLEKAKRDGVPYEMEFRFILPDKAVRWVHAKGDVKRDKKGNINALFGTIQDATDRKVAEEMIREERGKFATLIENAPFGLLMVDRQGKILYVNPKFVQLFGYELKDIPNGRTFFEKAYPEPLYREEVVTTWIKDLKTMEVGKKRARTFTLITKDGRERTVNFIPVQLETGEHIISCDDITEQKFLEEQLKNMAITDELTGIYNRRGFITLSEQQIKVMERTKKGMLLFYIDLDKMKDINDTFGHKAGDMALKDTAMILKDAFRDSDIIGRIGGDEFAVLAIDAEMETRDMLLRRLKDTLNRYNKKGVRVYELSLSIGCAYFDPYNPLSLDSLMSAADSAMYEEKKNKCFFGFNGV